MLQQQCPAARATASRTRLTWQTSWGREAETINGHGVWEREKPGKEVAIVLHVCPHNVCLVFPERGSDFGERRRWCEAEWDTETHFLPVTAAKEEQGREGEKSCQLRAKIILVELILCMETVQEAEQNRIAVGEGRKKHIAAFEEREKSVPGNGRRCEMRETKCGPRHRSRHRLRRQWLRHHPSLKDVSLLLIPKVVSHFFPQSCIKHASLTGLTWKAERSQASRVLTFRTSGWKSVCDHWSLWSSCTSPFLFFFFFFLFTQSE